MWKMSLDKNTNFGQMWSAGCGRFSFCELFDTKIAKFAIFAEKICLVNVILEQF